MCQILNVTLYFSPGRRQPPSLCYIAVITIMTPTVAFKSACSDVLWQQVIYYQHHRHNKTGEKKARGIQCFRSFRMKPSMENVCRFRAEVPKRVLARVKRGEGCPEKLIQCFGCMHHFFRAGQTKTAQFL